KHQVLFQIPAENADEAAFTLDGRFVVFTTKELRYEKWSVAEKNPVEVRELVLRRHCWEYRLSPDGNYVACVDTATRGHILDTKTGQKVWEKKDSFSLNELEYFSWLMSLSRRERGREGFFRIQFSPDSRSVVFSRSDRFRFRFRIDTITAAQTEDTAFALD